MGWDDQTGLPLLDHLGDGTDIGHDHRLAEGVGDRDQPRSGFLQYRAGPPSRPS